MNRHGVDMHRTALDPLRQSQASRKILRKDCGAKSVLCIICNLNRFGFSFAFSEPALAYEGAARNVMIAGAMYAAFLTNSLRDVPFSISL